MLGAGTPYLAPAEVAAGRASQCRELLLQVPRLLLQVFGFRGGGTVNGQLEKKAQLYSRESSLPSQLLHLKGFVSSLQTLRAPSTANKISTWNYEL